MTNNLISLVPLSQANLLLLRSEPVSGTTAIIYLLAICLVTIICVAVGAYVCIRVLAKIINARRDEWVGDAAPLNLDVDHGSGGLHKDLVGTRDGRTIRVSKYGIPRGENSSDDAISAQVSCETRLPFSFKIERREMLYQKAAYFFGNDDQIEETMFNGDFSVETSDEIGLTDLLNTEMLDGETATLLADIMVSRKAYHRVIITDNSVCVGLKAEPGDETLKERAIQKAFYLAARLEKAAKLSQAASQ